MPETQVVFYLENLSEDFVIKIGETNITAIRAINLPSVDSRFTIIPDTNDVPRLCEIGSSNSLTIKRSDNSTYVADPVSFVGSRPKGH